MIVYPDDEDPDELWPEEEEDWDVDTQGDEGVREQDFFDHLRREL